MAEQNAKRVKDPYREADELAHVLSVPDCSLDARIRPDDRILLIRLGGIGDAVRILPIAAYLRNTGYTGSLHCAVEPPVNDLFRFSPHVDHIHSIPLKQWLERPLQLFEEIETLRSLPFDWVFDCHGILKSGLLSALMSTRYRIGYHPSNSKENNELFQDQLISPLDQNLPRTLKYLQLLRPFTRNSQIRSTDLNPTLERFEPVRPPVRNAASDNPVLLHPMTKGGRYGSKKNWGPERFRTLLERLRPHLPAPVRITWGPGEQKMVEQLAAPFDESVAPAPETSPIRNLAYLIRHSRILITVDSSPAHIADLVGTPVTVLYEVGKEQINAPMFTPYRMISGVDDTGGSVDISVEQVYERCLELFDLIEDHEQTPRRLDDPG